MKKNTIILISFLSVCIILVLLIGISIRQNIKTHVNNTKIEETIQSNIKSEIDYGTNNILVEDIGKKVINNIQTDLYKINLTNIGINFSLPKIALKSNFDKINIFNEIKIESEKDFNNNYIMIEENSFTSFTPSTYFVIARAIDLDDTQKTQNNEEIVSSLFENSFITLNEITENKTINETNVLKYNIKLNPFGDTTNENNYDGKLIVYISNNKIKLLICGISTFSYESDAKLSLCEYVIESSSATF